MFCGLGGENTTRVRADDLRIRCTTLAPWAGLPVTGSIVEHIFLWSFSWWQFGLSRERNEPNEKFFGTDIPRKFGGHLDGDPGSKTSVGLSKHLKNKHLGTDIHDSSRIAEISDQKSFAPTLFSLSSMLLQTGCIKRGFGGLFSPVPSSVLSSMLSMFGPSCLFQRTRAPCGTPENAETGHFFSFAYFSPATIRGRQRYITLGKPRPATGVFRAGPETPVGHPLGHSPRNFFKHNMQEILTLSYWFCAVLLCRTEIISKQFWNLTVRIGSTTTRDRNLQSLGPVSLDYLNIIQWIFFFSLEVFFVIL